MTDQLTLLNNLLEVLAESNPFYRERIKEARLDHGAENVAQFTQRMPFTTKQEFVEDQRLNPPYGTNLTSPIERYTRYSQTSGTTGAPLRWPDTPESWSWRVDNWVEVLKAADVHAGDRIFFAFSFGPFIGFWLAFDAGERLGCLCIPGGGMTSAARLRGILDNRATVLCCTPTYAQRLAEVAKEEGIDLSQNPVRSIVVAGEPGASIPATRRLIEAGWPGARVFDHHGMTEVGPVTYQCPRNPGILHVMESAFLAEVIDQEFGAASTQGELVLTTLGRTASPVLRYRTGDFVRSATRDPCECGRSGLVLEGGILGRTDDMVVIRGVNLHPSAIEDIVRGFAEVAEYRVNVATARSLPEMRLEIEPVDNCADSARLARDVESALRNSFNLRIPTRAVRSLPRFELKSKRWNVGRE